MYRAYNFFFFPFFPLASSMSPGFYVSEKKRKEKTREEKKKKKIQLKKPHDNFVMLHMYTNNYLISNLYDYICILKSNQPIRKEKGPAINQENPQHPLSPPAFQTNLCNFEVLYTLLKFRGSSGCGIVCGI